MSGQKKTVSRMVARLLSGMVLSQAILSGGGFLIAFILLRGLGAEAYGQYVLVSAGLLFLAILQGSFLTVTTVIALADPDRAKRQAVMGRVLVARKQATWVFAVVFAVVSLLLWVINVVSQDMLILVFASIFTMIFNLRREFFRDSLIAHQRTGPVLLSDLLYVTCTFLAAIVATQFFQAVYWVVLGVGLAAWLSASVLRRSLWRHEPWDVEPGPNVWQDVTDQNAWSTFGASVHWSFNQGYSYLVAGLLDVRAVAALAATRLLLMPVNMLSSGVNQSLFPQVSRWIQEARVGVVFARILKICLWVSGLAMCYIIFVWMTHGWLFEKALKSVFEQAEQLIVLWSLVFLVTLWRDQIGCILMARGRLRAMGKVTFVCAGIALLAIVLLVPRVGAMGAVIGILLGEVLNLAGLLGVYFRESKHDRFLASQT